jgi:hypothetical protein
VSPALLKRRRRGTAKSVFLFFTTTTTFCGNSEPVLAVSRLTWRGFKVMKAAKEVTSPIYRNSFLAIFHCQKIVTGTTFYLKRDVRISP